MYDYELETTLGHLPVTVCCAEDLPAEINVRPQSFIVNTDNCDRKGTHWVAFHFPKEGPAEFFDSFGRAPETYHKRFQYVLIANGPQYYLNEKQIQSDDTDTCVYYCVHYIKSRYRKFTIQEVVRDLNREDLHSISAELKDIYSQLL